MFNNLGRIRDILIIETAMKIITNNTDGRGEPSKEDDRLLQLPLEE